MKLSNLMNFDLKQHIIAVWGWIILLASSVFLLFSQNFLVSSIFYFINMFISLYFIIFYKKIMLYSPKFLLLSALFINITFMALYYFSSLNNVFIQPRSLDNVFYYQIAFLYFVFILGIMLPFFLLFNVKFNLNLNFFKQNFNVDTLINYYYISTIINICLLFITFLILGISPLSALKNPWSFRMDFGSGDISYINKIFKILLNINTVLILKNIIIDNIKTKKFKIISVIHFCFLIVFGILSGARREFLFPVSAFILMYGIFKKIKIKDLIIASVLGLILMTFLSFYVMYRNYALLLASKVQVSSSVDFSDYTRGKNAFENTISRIDSFEKSNIFFDYIEKNYNTLFYFRDYHLLSQLESQLTVPIPRSIYPDKKYFFISEITDKIYPHLFKNAAFAWGGISNAFWNLGLGGILIEGFLFGLFIWFLEKDFTSLINYDLFFLIYFAYLSTFVTTFFEIGFLNTHATTDMFLGLFVILLISNILTKQTRLKI